MYLRILLNFDGAVQHTIKVKSIFAFGEVLLDGQASHLDASSLIEIEAGIEMTMI